MIVISKCLYVMQYSIEYSPMKGFTVRLRLRRIRKFDLLKAIDEYFF